MGVRSRHLVTCRCTDRGSRNRISLESSRLAGDLTSSWLLCCLLWGGAAMWDISANERRSYFQDSVLGGSSMRKLGSSWRSRDISTQKNITWYTTFRYCRCYLRNCTRGTLETLLRSREVDCYLPMCFKTFSTENIPRDEREQVKRNRTIIELFNNIEHY
jgi:hypothetical protein